MSLRPLLLAVPVALIAAGLSFSPASAVDNGADNPFELAQATPPAPPPPPAGREMRDRPAFSPKAFCIDQIARRAGNRTAMKIRLEL